MVRLHASTAGISLSLVGELRSHMLCSQKKNKNKNRNKIKTQRQITDWWLEEGKEGCRRAKWVREVNCMVMNGNKIFGGKHTLVYTEVEL